MTRFLTVVQSQCAYDAYHTSVRPMWGFLMRFCRQLLRVLVSSRLVDFRNMSSISVELETHLQLRNYPSLMHKKKKWMDTAP